MRRRSAIKWLSLGLCVLLLVFPFFSAFLSISHAQHNCLKDQCTVCTLIHSTRTLQRLLMAVCCGALATPILRYVLSWQTNAAAAQFPATLITLKVRMNP